MLWLELKLRGNMLDGSLSGPLIAFSQREIYSGPLLHWVALQRSEP